MPFRYSDALHFCVITSAADGIAECPFRFFCTRLM